MFVPKSDILEVLNTFEKSRARHVHVVELKTRSRLYISIEPPTEEMSGQKPLDVTAVFSGFREGSYNAELAVELVQDAIRLAE